MKFFLRKTETSRWCGSTGQSDLVQLFSSPVLWRVALLAIIPLILRAITDGRYNHVAERAGGLHFIIKIDRLNSEHACVIMETENISTALMQSLCKE